MIRSIQPSIISAAITGFLFVALMTNKDYQSLFIYLFLFVFIISLPINLLLQIFLLQLKTKYGIFFYFFVSAIAGAVATLVIKKSFINFSLEINLLDFYYLIFGIFAGIISSIVFTLFEIKK